MNSFSFAGSGSDLLDESSGWMDGCIPPSLVSTELSVIILIMIRLVPMACSVEWGINARLKQTIVLASLFTRVSPQPPELDSRRDGWVEVSKSILQSVKCWSVTKASQEGGIHLRLCDIYVCREIENVHTGGCYIQIAVTHSTFSASTFLTPNSLFLLSASCSI